MLYLFPREYRVWNTLQQRDDKYTCKEKRNVCCIDVRLGISESQSPLKTNELYFQTQQDLNL